MCVILSTFFDLKVPILNLLNFFSSRAKLSYKSLSYKTKCRHVLKLALMSKNQDNVVIRQGTGIYFLFYGDEKAKQFRTICDRLY